MTDSDSYELHGGDALDLLDDSEAIPGESVHAIVCDPPYGIAFMGESWDDFDPHAYQEWCKEWAETALRAVKPGGHLVAFSGERTFHRLMCGVEDAGWEIRTSVMWLHGQGFPKGQDVGKSIDRFGDGEDAGAWRGFKSQLKPAHEPIVVARKPLSERAIYRNVLEHGTGAYNIDACRIPIAGEKGHWPGPDHEVDDGANYGNSRTGGEAEHEKGRYPTNVALDAQSAAMLDAQSGDVGSDDSGAISGGTSFGTSEGSESDDPSAVYSDTPGGGAYTRHIYDDEGGASRFYYTSKASTSERTHDGEIDNDHPTVKPVDLMGWLVRLVTAEGQMVLDPFAGSGTTGVACLREGRAFVGIERDEEYREIARKRLDHTAADEAQQTLSDAAEAEADD